MAKKGRGKKNNPVEIVDDNGTLIAASAGGPGPVAREGGSQSAGKPESRRPPADK
jgi:hypothetical protein